MHYLGFDIGGTETKVALIKDKQIIKSICEDSPDNLEGLLNLAKKMKMQLIESLAGQEIGGIGFSIAGVLDMKREAMSNSPNIQYLNDQPIKKLLEEKLNPFSIKIEHDVHCFLLAEKEVGLARGFKNVVYLTVGTGVGGALMINGEIQDGAHGASGEIGHMIIEAGQQLDLENLTANNFVKKRLGVSAAEAEKLVRSGDEKAKEVFEERGKNLGIGLANIINIFDPEAVIIGGGVVSAQEFILSGIREGIEKFVISPEAKKTKILFSELGQFGGALGAAMLFNE
jgi:glucokinase